MPRERLDKKDASDAEKIDAALFLRPKPLRRQIDGRDLFHAMPGKPRQPPFSRRKRAARRVPEVTAADHRGRPHGPL